MTLEAFALDHGVECYGFLIGPPAWQLDVGAGDPMVLPPQPQRVLGVDNVACCAPEVLYGWKAHGLFERGEGRWRAKDLWDLYPMQTHLPMDPHVLVDAVRVAFPSRSTPLSVTQRFFDDDGWGRSRGSLRKWAKFQREAFAASAADLHDVKSAVVDRLGQVLRRI